MEDKKKKIRSFTDLGAWKEGHKLVVAIYTMTKKLPAEEKFGLASQMQRSAVSVTSNIAEGFGRQGKKEKDSILFNGSWFAHRVAEPVACGERRRTYKR